MLHPAIVARTNQLAARVKNRRADGNAAFGQPFSGFSQRDGEHCGVVETQLRVLRASL